MCKVLLKLSSCVPIGAKLTEEKDPDIEFKKKIEEKSNVKKTF